MTGGILVVDDIATNRVVYKVKLEQAFRQTMLAEDGQGCLRQVRDNRPDLILLDLNLPDMSGIDVLHRLRADPATRRIPVIVVSASTDRAQRLAALAAGAEDYMEKPTDDRILNARIRNLLRWQEDVADNDLPLPARYPGLAEDSDGFARPGHVALVMGRTDREIALRRQLARTSLDRVTCLTHRATLESDGPDSPDVFVVDAELGGPDGGLRLLTELRSRAETRHAGICLWLAAERAQADTVSRAFDLGADDVLTAAVPEAEVSARLAGVLRRRREAGQTRRDLRDRARLAVVDPLTGLWNRRYALPCLASMIRQAGRAGPPLALMLIDLDHFKQVNDARGHAAGDAVLAEMGKRLTAALPEGLVARIGGDEFIAALPVPRPVPAGQPCLDAGPDPDPGSARRMAWQRAEAICDRLTGGPVMLGDGGSVRVTASIGVAMAAADDSAETLIDRADRALYGAKSGGRNRVGATPDWMA